MKAIQMPRNSVLAAVWLFLAAAAILLPLQVGVLAGPSLLGIASVLALIGLQRTQRWRVSGTTFTRRFYLVVFCAFLVNCLALIALRIVA